MPRPTIEAPQVLLADDHLALVFPYDAAQVREVKTIPGAKWDRLARVWRVPIAQLPAVRAFATKHRFWIDPDVVGFDLPAPARVPTGIGYDDDWVWLNFGYDPVRVRAVKQIPGVTWDATTKGWRVPMTSLDEALAWAMAFNHDVPDELRRRAAVLAAAADKLAAASRAVDADLEVAGLPLLPYQRAGVAYASTSKRAILADDMGLGKTIQAIATLEHVADTDREDHAYPAVVVCPPSLVLNWAKEYARWLPHRRVAVVTNRKEFPDAGSYDVVIVGYANLHHWATMCTKHRAVVFDESHYLKNPGAQRTKAAIKVAKSVPATGIVLCLTGTPITNRPDEYVSQLQILGRLDLFGGKMGFWRRYCNAFKDRYGHWHTEGHSNLDELNDRLRASGTYLRRVKAEVLDELPPVRHDPLVVEGDASAMREYRKAEADIVAYLVERARQIAEELGVSPGTAAVRARMAAESAEHLVRLAVLRKLAARAKLTFVHEWVTDHVEAGRKVVLAAHHREIVDDLAAPWGGLKIQGQMSVAEVEAAKARFQDGSVDDAPVLVLSIQAAKTGHTLTAAQDIGFVELPFTPSDVDQTYSRLHRLGQRGSVTATYLLAAGTIDEDLHALIEAKRAVVDAATEGGVAREASADRLVAKYLGLGLT